MARGIEIGETRKLRKLTCLSSLGVEIQRSVWSEAAAKAAAKARETKSDFESIVGGLERVLFTASGSVRTFALVVQECTGAERAARVQSRAEQRTRTAAGGIKTRRGPSSICTLETSGTSWRFDPAHQPQYVNRPNCHPNTQNFHPKPLYHRLLQLITTLIVSQGVQHRMQFATSCSACIIQSDSSCRQSPASTRRK